MGLFDLLSSLFGGTVDDLRTKAEEAVQGLPVDDLVTRAEEQIGTLPEDAQGMVEDLQQKIKQ